MIFGPFDQVISYIFIIWHMYPLQDTFGILIILVERGKLIINHYVNIATTDLPNLPPPIYIKWPHGIRIIIFFCTYLNFRNRFAMTTSPVKNKSNDDAT